MDMRFGTWNVRIMYRPGSLQTIVEEILREEHRVRVFENRVLRRTIGPKRDEVTGG
jgi:hypothetical protein